MRSVWKPLYISLYIYKKLKSNFFFKKLNFKQENPDSFLLVDRNVTILLFFNKFFFKIYNGCVYKNFIVSSVHIGHKFGEFFLTRKRAIFKLKPNKKK